MATLQSCTRLDHLPHELLISIFQYVPIAECVHDVQLVCRQFCAAARFTLHRFHSQRYVCFAGLVVTMRRGWDRMSALTWRPLCDRDTPWLVQPPSSSCHHHQHSHRGSSSCCLSVWRTRRLLAQASTLSTVDRRIVQDDWFCYELVEGPLQRFWVRCVDKSSCLVRWSVPVVDWDTWLETPSLFAALTASRSMAASLIGQSETLDRFAEWVVECNGSPVPETTAAAAAGSAAGVMMRIVAQDAQCVYVHQRSRGHHLKFAAAAGAAGDAAEERLHDRVVAFRKRDGVSYTVANTEGSGQVVESVIALPPSRIAIQLRSGPSNRRYVAIFERRQTRTHQQRRRHAHERLSRVLNGRKWQRTRMFAWAVLQSLCGEVQDGVVFNEVHRFSLKSNGESSSQISFHGKENDFISHFDRGIMCVDTRPSDPNQVVFSVIDPLRYDGDSSITSDNDGVLMRLLITRMANLHVEYTILSRRYWVFAGTSNGRMLSILADVQEMRCYRLREPHAFHIVEEEQGRDSAELRFFVYVCVHARHFKGVRFFSVESQLIDTPSTESINGKKYIEHGECVEGNVRDEERRDPLFSISLLDLEQFRYSPNVQLVPSGSDVFMVLFGHAGCFCYRIDSERGALQWRAPIMITTAEGDPAVFSHFDITCRMQLHNVNDDFEGGNATDGTRSIRAADGQCVSVMTCVRSVGLFVNLIDAEDGTIRHAARIDIGDTDTDVDLQESSQDMPKEFLDRIRSTLLQEMAIQRNGNHVQHVQPQRCGIS